MAGYNPNRSGARIEANTDVTQPISERVIACMRGMLDARFDEDNDNPNRANAMRVGIQRLLHIFC